MCVSKPRRQRRSIRFLFPLIAILASGLASGLPVIAGSSIEDSAEQSEAGAVGLPRFPSISPDGSEIVFSWGGDLWRVPSSGGEALRLTRSAYDDLHSSWSRDGRRLVFTSMRDGYLNLWRINRDGTTPTQLTWSDRFMRNPAFTVDREGNEIITFSGSLEADVYRDERPYRVSAAGGEHHRIQDAFGSEPKLSPDGTQTVFTRGGHYHGWARRHYRGPDSMDVWLHDHDENSFTQITDRDGDDGSAQWVDETTLLFMSDRDLGTVNLFRVRLDDQEIDGEFERITDFDRYDIQNFDVSHDGSSAVMQVWDRIYTLDLADPQAQPQGVTLRAGDDGREDHELRRIDREITEARLSPDAQVMAYIAYGRVYIRNMEQFSPTRAVTPNTHARHSDLAWSADGLHLYFTSDSDGTSSIYRARVELTREEIRRGFEERPEEETPDDEPPLLAEDDSLVEASLPQRSGELYRDAVTRQPGLNTEDPVDPFAPVDPGLPYPADPVPLTPQPTDPAVPPQEPPHDPPYDPMEPPLHQQPAEPGSIPEEELAPPAPSPPDDDVTIDRDPTRWHDAIQFSIEPAIATASNDRHISPSPDGRYLAFRRGRGDIVLHELDSGEERVLVEGWDSAIQWRWSPDSRHIAYVQNDMNFSANIYIVPSDGSQAAVNVTRHPRNDRNPRWSADGRVLTFISNRAGGSYDLYRVYLDRELENFSAREITAYYRDARTAAARIRPLPPGEGHVAASGPDAAEVAGGTPSGDSPQLHLEDAWRRVQRITASPAHQFANEMTPGGDRYVFNSSAEGIIAMNWDGSSRQRIAPPASVQDLTITGDRLVYIANGRVGVVSLAGGAAQFPDISDRIRIDLREQSLQKFRETARVIEESFYRSDMKGLDWTAVAADYEKLIGRSRTPSEFSDITNRLMGELAASHLGVTNPGPASALREPSGRLGVDHERLTLADGRSGYRIHEVIPDGPAARATLPLSEGDVITSIDLRPFDVRDSMTRVLRGRIGQEVIVTFERPVGARRTEYRTLVTPVGYAELARLKYDSFREQRRRRVHELSDGRIGYIHIQAMNQQSLEAFQGDLYAAAYGKDGLIIDVRNNGGGNTTDRILTSIMASDHAYTIPAGADPADRGFYPHDRLDAPRYTLPINMLANEKSFSNAEILAHAFSTLDRGTLVGRQTYGGVISTGSYTLIDGATVRRPFRGWFLPDGTDMEHNGALPDMRVDQTPYDETTDVDRQLKAAVEEMLDRW